MLRALPGSAIEPILTKAPPGLVGMLGFKIIDPSTGDIVAPHRQAGITEPAPGNYWTTSTAPTRADMFLIVWDYVDPDTMLMTVPTEELYVTVDMSIDPAEPIPDGTYTTVTAVRSYAPELSMQDDDSIKNTIRKAERDVDGYAGFGGAPNVDTGLRFDPVSDLDVTTRDALSRATCAQTQYRFYMGDAFFVDEVQYIEVRGDEGTKKPSRYGPQMKAEFPRELGKHTGNFV